MIDCAMSTNTETPMACLTFTAPLMIQASSNHKSSRVMTAVATVMNGIIQGINRDAGGGACGADMTGRARSGHGHGQTVINAVSGGMDSQPIAAMARVAIPGAGGGQTYQHPTMRLVMAEITIIVMNCGRGDGIAYMTTLASVIGGGADHTTMIDIGMEQKIVCAVTGITIIKRKRIAIRHGMARGAVNQSNRGCS